MWERQIADLATPGRTVLAPSLPGFGGTPVPAVQPSLDDYADALMREVDAAGLRHVVACGLSMGGYVAFALLRRHRERVAGLVLADTKAEPDTEEGKAGRIALAARVREVGAERAFFAATPPPWLRPESVHWPLLRSIILRQPPEAIAQASLAMAGRPDSRPDLATVDVPTAVVVGDRDPITTPENARTIAGGIRGATLAILAEAGHLSNLEQPAAFNLAVNALLAKLGI